MGTIVVTACALLTAWLAFVTALWLLGRRVGEDLRLTDALRLVPDIVRLVRRLAGDRTLPSGVRVRLVLLLAYLASPLDLVPDVVPVVGYADDVVLVALVLRSVVRRTGPEALSRHWPGSPEGLRLVRRLAGVSGAPVGPC